MINSTTCFTDNIERESKFTSSVSAVSKFIGYVESETKFTGSLTGMCALTRSVERVLFLPININSIFVNWLWEDGDLMLWDDGSEIILE